MLGLSGRPLLDNPGDQALFVGRDDVVGRALRALRRGANVLLVGDRGAGKTSTLHRLALLLRQGGRLVVVLDGRPSPQVLDLLHVLRWRLGGEGGADPFAAQGETERTLMLLRSIEERARDLEGVVLLDEAGGPEAARALFGRLRDELWRLPLSWLVTAATGDRAAYLAPPADAFFARALDLSPLDLPEAMELLERRAPELDAGARRLLAERAGGHPRTLVQMAQEVLLGEGGALEVAEARARRQGQVERMGEAARRLFAELVASGGLSVSDPEVLRRLGWSRPRAQQVVSRLEDAGLVEFAMAPPGRGRPRKLYRPRAPLAGVPFPLEGEG